MFKLKISVKVTLTPAVIDEWYVLFSLEKEELKNKLNLYLNKNKDDKAILKMPFAKKLVLTSAASTVGNGVTISPCEDFEHSQQTLFDDIKQLFKKQTISAHDAAIVKDGCIFGKAYELAYMSDDEVPVPKVAKIPATNAFVVYDDTVEQNSLYGVFFEEYKNANGQDKCRFFIYDNAHKWQYDNGTGGLVNCGEHHMGRVPLTEYLNNDEEQGDFEQVVPLMYDRTTIHDLNIKDMKTVAKNYLKGRNIDFAGRTEEEKKKSMQKAAELNLLEIDAEDPSDDITILSKNENYSSVDVFGKDIDSKIYDLSMIPDLSDDNFAGNQSGVALELKLKPFKELVKAKDVYIERLYRRRIKMYMTALLARESGVSAFDVSEIDIAVQRTWAENTLEIAQIVSTLAATGLFSDEYLISKLPDADYATEIKRQEEESKTKGERQTAVADPNNFSLESLTSLLRGGDGIQ